MAMTPVPSPAWNCAGFGPQIMVATPRRMTARPIVTMTIEKAGSPSIGRMTSRSIARPISIAIGRTTRSNGKKERWYKTLKGECIRVKTPLSLADARRIVADFVAHYNGVRLHSAIGYVTPADKLAGRDRQIFAERDRKLDAARERRKAARAASRADAPVDPGQPIARPIGGP